MIAILDGNRTVTALRLGRQARGGAIDPGGWRRGLLRDAQCTGYTQPAMRPPSALERLFGATSSSV